MNNNADDNTVYIKISFGDGVTYDQKRCLGLLLHGLVNHQVRDMVDLLGLNLDYNPWA